MIFVKLSETLPTYTKTIFFKSLTPISLHLNLNNFIFINYYATWPWLFPAKQAAVHIQSLENFASAGSISTNRSNIPFKY